MRYPFLEQNEIILIDYLPGSSGQLLMRLWSELDSRMAYDNPDFLTTTSITGDPSSREIDFDIVVPKKMTNWFLNKCEPSTVEDHLAYFDLLGTMMVALNQRWKHGSSDKKFYDSNSYKLEGHRLIYGIHTWEKLVPFDEMAGKGAGIRRIGVVPTTERGRDYQIRRCQACYPLPQGDWELYVSQFNSKPFSESIDVCTMLVDGDVDGMISWLESSIGSTVRTEKLSMVRKMIADYHEQIVKRIYAV